MQNVEELFSGRPWGTSTARLDEGTLSYVDGGDGHPVLLLHGFPERWFSWRHQMSALVAAGYRVIVPDLPGYGGSTAKSYAVEELAELFGAFLDKLGVESCFVVGHDWGGMIGFELAARFPWKVDRFALLNSPPLPALEGLLREDPRQALRLWYGLMFQLPGAPECLASPFGRRFMGWVLERTLVRPSEKLIAMWTDSFDTGQSRAAISYYREAFRLLTSPLLRLERRRMRQARVRCSSLVLWGEDDWALAPKIIAHIEKLHSGWLKFRPIPGAGHFVQQDAPEEVNRELLDFFSARVPEREAAIWR